MRLMFIYYLMDDAGSAQDVRNYTLAARELGHEVVVYGPENRRGPGPITCSRDIDSADAVIFIFEWTTNLRYGDQLDLARMITRIPREKRFVIDCDGAYNNAINIQGDYNHGDDGKSRTWMDTCNCLSDRIFQPTLHPMQPNVQTFFFHAYDPAWAEPLDFRSKEFGMIYVGHSKFRWGPMKRVLSSIQPVRSRVGRLGIIGHGWDAMPAWAAPMHIENYYFTEPEYLKKLGVEVMQPIGSDAVIDWMGKAWFNPVIYRPLFSYLRLVTCRTFETPGANTIPLFGLDASYVREIYGEAAEELVLPEEGPEEKIIDLFERPDYYADIILQIRKRLAKDHSYTARLQQLIEIVSHSERSASATGGAQITCV